MASGDPMKTECNSVILQPGQIIRPSMTESTAKEIVLIVYGLNVTSLQEFNSYNDRNFYVKVENHFNNPHIQEVDPDGYIFKVVNSMDSQKPDLIDAQNKLMLYMHNQGIKVQIPLQNVHGSHQSLEKIISADGKDSSYNIVRLLTYIPGVIIYNVVCTRELCYQVGKLAAAVDKALKGFHHSAYDTHQTLWMLSNAPQIKQFLFAIQNDHHKTLVESVLEDFESRVLANMDKLPKGMIHGDINEQNIIVRESESDAENYEINGLLDVGDSQYNCYLFELTLATTYMMLMGNDDNFVELGTEVIAGYISECPISQLEWDLLKICIETRYCQSLVMGAYTHHQDPSNTYVLTTSKKGWKQLKKFRSISQKALQDIWKATLHKNL